jgi:gas vesicle protein
MNDYKTFGEYRYSDRNNNTATVVTFLLLGLGLGALTALLLAPKSGRQMRRSLRRKYEDARERVDDFSDQANEYLEKGSKWANAAKKKVRPIAKSFSRG